MNVSSIMSTPVVTVEMDDSLSQVKEIFENTNFHHLLVVEGRKLYGVISDRDLLKAISPNIGTAAESASDTATLNKRVHQIMSRKPISIMHEENVSKAIEIFTSNKISCIPVVDESDVPIGILSWRDILKAINIKT